MKTLRNRYLSYLDDAISTQQSETKQHIDNNRQIFANNRNSAGFSSAMKELTFTQCIESSEGAYVNDLNGNRLLDITMGFGVHLFGHQVPFIDDAIRSQLEKGFALGPLYRNAADVARLINELTGSERSAFYNTGTEAVMVAMRLAKAKTGKDKIVIFQGCYHGTHDTVLAMKRDKATKAALTTTPGVSNNILSDTMLLDFGTQDALDYLAENADTIAAVLTEPVQSRHPEWCNGKFLKSLRSVTEENGIALIFDEVITGFRIANGGGAEYFQIEPDISTYGKVLGGGLPIGVVSGKAEYLDFVDGGGSWHFGDESGLTSPMTFVAGTFCHHPLSMATAKATLEHLKHNKGNIQKELNKKTTDFCIDLNAFFSRYGFPLEVVNFGSLFRFLLKGRARYLFYALLKEGVYIWEGRNCFLSTAHTNDDIDLLKQKIKKVALELHAADLIIGDIPDENLSAPLPLTQIAMELDKSTDLDAFVIAARVTMLGIPGLTDKQISINTIELESEEGLNDALGAAQTHQTSSAQLTILTSHESTVAHIGVYKKLCDGWSLTLLAKTLENNYLALTENRPMPESKVIGQEHFEDWIKEQAPTQKPSKTDPGNFDMNTAKTVFRHYDEVLDLPMQGATEFEYLLTRFIDETDCLNRPVSVPIAGQLISRNLRVFGNCGSHLTIATEPSPSFNKRLESVKDQLKTAKSQFINNYYDDSNKKAIIFNYDNLKEVPFSTGKKTIYPLEEAQTQYPLVCNVTRTPDGYSISYKYNPKDFDAAHIIALADRFEDVFLKSMNNKTVA